VDANKGEIDRHYVRQPAPAAERRSPGEIAASYPKRQGVGGALIEKAVAGKDQGPKIQVINGEMYQKVNGGWAKIKAKGQP
jgi:hypothetical protein